ncbi:ThuA domain-containing protein [Pollutibacter soli]|uniref:ThuA domain-containing protein n=1 Tax=Pollutibacter soli TaxID=3034157 RepID=UPI003013ACB7
MHFNSSALKSIAFILLTLSVLVFADACNSDSGPRILVFSKTNGFKHASIPAANDALIKMGKEKGFAVDTTTDATLFTDDKLKKYDAVVFANTTRNVLNAKQQAAFERFIQAGGGYVGIHSAADTEYEWPWYGKLVGAWFSSHPSNSNVRKANVHITDTSFIATKGLPAVWERTDEWYNYKNIYSGIKVVANLDEGTYEGGTNGNDHPISWYHDFDGGRAFYTGLGHEISNYTDPAFLNHLWGGLQYAMGNGKLDYDKAYAVEVPEENRFVKTVLVNDLSVPMELAVSDEGEVFYTELSTANLYMYDVKSGKNKLVHRFDVANKGGTGLIGVTLDPNYSKNRFIYLYYSPPTETEPIDFYLSRFTVKADNTLDTASEKILLKVPVQINSGAHHGGSLAWDKDGNLYLSTGDSTTPFPSDGYSPMDERPEKEFYSQDAQRSSANTNDFKGKILRIHPEPDGSYTIPKGNLFPPGTEKTKPEIYVMGCRNPYRIAVNPQTSTVYWGEIGPDAGNDSPERGPRGYDEFNQAKTAGFYGWPYFVGNNQAYADWDFATKKGGPKFVADAPENNSPNNTGLNKLPPARAAMIFYPYAASDSFPELGAGGRSAMAGQFYTYDKSASFATSSGSSSSASSAQSAGAFPEYYNGALFVFDWMRNWVLALRFDKDENYLRSEPFMAANGDFRRPIDLAFGKDGVMYMLEYGSVYGADNDDARLVKIEYKTGNRPPVANAFIRDSAAQASLAARVYLTSENRAYPKPKEIAGPAPLRVLFSSMGSSDPDDDDVVSYEWQFENANDTSTSANPVHVFTKPGNYKVVLTAKDLNGGKATDTVQVRVGNAMPVVEIASKQNKSFYWPGEVFDYAVKVSDAEDGADLSSKAVVYYSYNKDAGNLSNDAATLKSRAGLTAENPHPGAALIASNDCKACHTVNSVSVGPSYTAVAERYKDDKGALAKLSQKVIAGGGGNWGKEHVMAAHPQLAPSDVSEMVKYILSLADARVQPKNIAPNGNLQLNAGKADDPAGMYTIVATYADKGAGLVGALTGYEVISLRSADVKPVQADAHPGFGRFGRNLSGGGHGAHILLKNIDLTHIKKISFELSSDKGGAIEVRKDSYAGPIIATATFDTTAKGTKAWVAAPLTSAMDGRHDLYFVVVKRSKPDNGVVNVGTVRFER